MKKLTALTALGAVFVLALGADDCSEGNPDDGRVKVTMAKPKVNGRCPGQMFVGLPVVLNFRVTNPGQATYPATYFGFFDGSGPLVLNSGASDGAPGIPGSYGPQGKGYQFRGPLDSNFGTRKLRLIVTPKDAGNFDALDMGVWGGREDMDRVPFGRVARFTCDNVTISP